jgi:hypothetical protein
MLPSAPVHRAVIAEGMGYADYESLVAELDGQIVAAVSLDGATVIANPFVRTAALVDVLRDQVGAPEELSATPRRFLPALRPLRR